VKPTRLSRGAALTIAPVSRRTVAEQIRADLSARVTSGELRPGERVPSERMLCDQYEVARTSVREAIQGLVSTGLVVRRGNRTYVTEQLDGIDLNSGSRKLIIAELFETRLTVEAPLAQLAAQRANAKERAKLVSMAAAFKATMPWRRFHPANEEFHWAIADAAGNSLLSELYGKILDAFLRSSEYASLTEEPLSAADRREVILSSGVDHQAIAAAIDAQDAAAAYDAAAQHLRHVLDQMVPLLP
jgi:GntR family transcriptional regulator, transcriptional repressor for pyruvate dehydrogenase complex